MRKITVLIGLPASGKSTYAKTIDGAIVLSSDEIRKELYGDESIQGNPKEVFSTLHTIMEDKLHSKDAHIVIDATNMNRFERSSYVKAATNYNCDELEAIIFKTSVAECVRRNEARDRKVRDFVFDKMIAKYEEPTISEGFDTIRVIY